MPKIIYFDRLIFEARYAFGSTYLDRAGQTLVDIERNRPGWIPRETTPQGGGLIHADCGYAVAFNSSLFSFSVTRSDDPDELRDVEKVASEIEAVWKVIKANLGVREFPRVAARFFFLAPADSEDAAEQIVERSPLRIVGPEALLKEHQLYRRNIVAVVRNADTEYRIDLHGVIQTTALGASDLLTTSPRLLSRGQRDAQIALVRARERQVKNPRYGANLDIDCSQYDLTTVSPREFVLAQFEYAQKHFKPLLVV